MFNTMFRKNSASGSALAYTVLLIAVISGVVMASSLTIRSDYATLNANLEGQEADRMALLGIKEADVRVRQNMMSLGEGLDQKQMEYGVSPLTVNNYDDYLGSVSYYLAPRTRGYKSSENGCDGSWMEDPDPVEQLLYQDFKTDVACPLDLKNKPSYKIAIHRFAMVPADQSYTIYSQELRETRWVAFRIRKMQENDQGLITVKGGVNLEYRVNNDPEVHTITKYDDLTDSTQIVEIPYSERLAIQTLYVRVARYKNGVTDPFYNHGPVLTFRSFSNKPFLISTNYTTVESIGMSGGHASRLMKVYYGTIEQAPGRGAIGINASTMFKSSAGFDNFGWCASGCRP